MLDDLPFVSKRALCSQLLICTALLELYTVLEKQSLPHNNPLGLLWVA